MSPKSDAAADAELILEDAVSQSELRKRLNERPLKLKVREDDIPLADMLPGAGGNVFCLARIAMIRALQIHEGSKPLIAHDPDDKVTSIALREIAQGKVAFKK